MEILFNIGLALLGLYVFLILVLLILLIDLKITTARKGGY